MGITADEVVKAYKETGFKPAQGRWYVKHSNCACGLTAVAVTKQSDIQKFLEIKPDFMGAEVRRATGLSFDYTTGFTHGFDGKPRSIVGPASDRYMEGYEDGVTAWEAVKTEFKLEGRE